MHLKWLAKGAGTALLGAITGAARDNNSSSADDALIDTRLTHCSVKCCQTAEEIDQISTSFVTRIVMKAIDLIMSSLDFRIEQMKRKKQKQRKKRKAKNRRNTAVLRVIRLIESISTWECERHRRALRSGIHTQPDTANTLL